MYELHPGHMYLKHLVERVESWWAPPWVGWVGGHPPGWSKLQMVDGCASRLLERPPNTTPVAKHPQWTNTRHIEAVTFLFEVFTAKSVGGSVIGSN